MLILPCCRERGFGFVHKIETLSRVGQEYLQESFAMRHLMQTGCLCQRTGNHRRQTDWTLSGGCSRRKTESRTAPPHCTSGKGGYCTDHRRRRRSQRSSYAGSCRTRNRLPRQAQSGGQCQAINQHYRTGWSALFPRVQRFLLEYVIRPKNRLSLLTNKIKE